MARRMNAQYAGRCRCNTTFPVGASIDFEKGMGVVGCEACGFTGTNANAPAPAPVVSAADLVAARIALNARLTPEQTAVASWRPGASNLRVVAAAGSGKTTTTVALVANLLEAGVNPRTLVVTTFTSKAAAELVERLARVVTPANLEAMSVGTFHAIAGRALRASNRFPQARNCDSTQGRAKDVYGAGVLWSKALGTERIMALGDVYGIAAGMEAEGEYPLAIEAECRSKGYKLGSPEALAACEATGLPKLHEAWGLYEAQKRAQQSWDFSDLLEAFHAFSKTCSGMTVIVDEAQDNSTLQIQIAQELGKRGGNVVLVGDVRQSIYEWRGAAPDLFLNADATMNAATLYLTANYRSGSAIVELGNAVAEGRTWSLGPAARAAKPMQGDVSVTGYSTPDDEARAVATEIALRAADGEKLSDFAILCRTRAQQGLFEAGLLTKRIPVAIVGGSSFFAGREWREYAALLSMVYGGATAMDAERVVKATEGCGYWTARNVAQSMERGLSLTDALEDAADNARSARQRTPLLDLIRFLSTTAALPFSVGCSDVAARLAAAAGNGQADDDAQGSYAACFDIAMSFAPKADATLKLGSPEALAAYAAAVAEARAFGLKCESAAVRLSDGETADRVCISTIHKAKGREWATVFVDATSGVFPHNRCATSERRLEEEARLFYVAVTRAATTLRLSYCVSYSKTQGGPSSFLDFVTPTTPTGTEPQGGKVATAPTAPETAPAALPTPAPVSEGVPAAAKAHEAVSAPVETVAAAPETFEQDADALRAALKADAARAETLADAGVQPAPGQRFVPVALADFEALLAPHGFERDAAASARARQETLSVTLTGETRLLVYTTVPVGAGSVRDVGEDSIKVALIGPKGRPLMRKQPYACRTRNWRSTLLDRLDTALATLGAPCAKCGGPTVAREGQRGTFHGCASYPECAGFAVRRAAPAAAATPAT